MRVTFDFNDASLKIGRALNPRGNTLFTMECGEMEWLNRSTY